MPEDDAKARERPVRLKVLVQEAEQALARWDVFRARDLFQQALAIDPRNESALFGLGSLFENMGNNPPGIMARQDFWMDAIKTFEKLMEVAPGHVEAHAHAGYTHMRYGESAWIGDVAQNEFDKALECLDKALKLDPKHAGAWYASAHVHLRLGQRTDAIRAFKKAAELAPMNIDAWWNLGILLEQEERYQEALDAFQKVETLDPKQEDLDEKLQRLRVRLEQRQGKEVNAQEDDAALAQLNIGTKLLAESNFPKAIQFLSKALAHFEATHNLTGQLEATRNIAAAHKGLRQWEPAREALLKGRDLAERKGDRMKQAEASHNLGYVCFLAGHFADAITHFTESTSLYREIGDKPKLADGLANLAKSYNKTGDHARALQSLEEALEADVSAGNLWNQVNDHCKMAEIHQLAGDIAKAKKHYRSAIAICEQLKLSSKAKEIQKLILQARKPEKKTPTCPRP